MKITEGKIKAETLTVEKLGDTAHARKTDPDTSHAAAQSVRNVSEVQTRVLQVFASRSALNYEQLCRWYHDAWRVSASEQSIRSRAKELRDMGLIEDCGKSPFNTRAGRSQRQYRITAEGMALLREKGLL